MTDGRRFRSRTRQSLQRHRNSLELLALRECDFGNGAAILQRWRDTHCAEASVASQGSLHRCLQRDLGLGHRRTLALCGGVIFAFSIGSVLMTAPLLGSTTTSKNFPPVAV